MALDVFVTHDTRVGRAEQSAWGTAEADAVAVVEVDIEKPEVSRDVKIRDSESANASRAKLQASITADTKGSLPTFTIAGVVKMLDLAEILYAHFQTVTEGESTPFDKTFIHLATQPDFTLNAGFFATWFFRNPVAATSIKASDCISQALTLSCEAGDRLKASQEWIGRAVPVVNSDPSGTWAREANDFFHMEDLARFTVDYGGGAVALIAHSFEIALSHPVAGIGQDSGNYQSLAIPKQEDSIKIVALWDANARTAYTNLDAGTAITVNIGWGNASPGTVEADLDFTIKAIVNDVKEAVISDDVLGMEISATIAGATATDSITVVMADASDRTW